MIPPARHSGRRRSVNVREVLSGIFYILWTGCQWKALPKDLPPKSTVYDYLELYRRSKESQAQSIRSSKQPTITAPVTPIGFTCCASRDRRDVWVLMNVSA